MAPLSEKRLSQDSDDMDVGPLELETYRKPPSRAKPARPRLRPRASGKKPPVAPPLAPGRPMVAVEEVPLGAADSAMLDGMSPVSSFVGSVPSSPGVSDRCSEVPSPGGAGMVDDIRELRRTVLSWDRRIGLIELKQRRLMRQVARLDKKLTGQ